MSCQEIVPSSYRFMDESRLKRLTFSLGIRAGGYAWLSGHTGVRQDPTGSAMVMDPSLREQMAVAYEKVDTILAAAGLASEDVVHIVEYIPSPYLSEHTAVAADVRRELGHGQAHVFVAPIVRLLRDGARIEVEVVARERGSSSSLRFLSGAGSTPEAAVEDVRSRMDSLRSSPGEIVRTNVWAVGETTQVEDLHISCVVGTPDSPSEPSVRIDIAAGIDREVTPVFVDGHRAGARVDDIVSLTACIGAGDRLFADELRANYELIGRALASLGSDLRSVVKTVELITEPVLEGYAATADVRRLFFSSPFPAATGVIVSSLPGDARVVVEATAVLSS